MKRAEKQKKANIGVAVKPPESQCNDPNCPFHGRLSVRGQLIRGIVVSDKMSLTALVKKEYLRKLAKYERYEKRAHKYAAHNPPCINAKAGDRVKIMECRPLSKTVAFVIIEKSEQK